jgi:hypothetical protein
LTSITYRWLAADCSGTGSVVFTINGSTASSTAPSGGICDCLAGAQEHVVTDPAALGLVLPGNNNFATQIPPSVAYSWGKAILGFADGTTTSTVLWDVGAGAASENPDVCDTGYLVSPASLSATVVGSPSSCD